MKNLMLICLIIFLFMSCRTFNKQEEEKNKEIQQITNEHKAIPGTRISVIPDSTFVIQNKYPQLIDSSGTQIGITDMPVPFYIIQTSHTREKYASGDPLGMTHIELKDLKNTNYNGYEALEILAIREEYGIKSRQYILMFGNDENTISLVVDKPFKEMDGISDQLKRMVKSAVFEPDRTFDPTELLDFKINVDHSFLKLVAVQPWEVIYTNLGSNGADDITNHARYFEILKRIGNYEKTPEYLEEFMNIHTFGWGKIESFESKNISIGSINGIEGYGQVLDKYTHKRILVYGAILFVSDDIAYFVNGDTKLNNEKDIKLYKEIVRTFYLK